MLLSNIFTRSGIFRHLFVVLYLRWIHSITNSSTYNYQTLAKWNFWNLSVSCISHFYIIFWYYVRYNYSNFPQTDGGFELESTINLLLQTKRLIAQVRHSHAIHVRVKKYKTVLMIRRSYTLINFNKLFLPWAIGIFCYVERCPIV